MNSLILFCVGLHVTFWPGQKAPKGIDLTQERRCVFVVHNSVHCVVLVGVDGAPGRGALQTYLHVCRFRLRLKWGLLTPTLK